MGVVSAFKVLLDILIKISNHEHSKIHISVRCMSKNLDGVVVSYIYFVVVKEFRTGKCHLMETHNTFTYLDTFVKVRNWKV